MRVSRILALLCCLLAPPMIAAAQTRSAVADIARDFATAVLSIAERIKSTGERLNGKIYASGFHIHEPFRDVAARHGFVELEKFIGQHFELHREVYGYNRETKAKVAYIEYEALRKFDRENVFRRGDRLILTFVYRADWTEIVEVYASYSNELDP